MRALEIIDSEGELRSAYALWRVETARDDPEREPEHFLVWIVSLGRKSYVNLNVKPAWLAFLAEPSDPYLSRLEAYLAKKSGNGAGGPPHAGLNRSHMWYYAEAVASYGLGGFVLPRETAALARIAVYEAGAGHAPISLLDLIVHATNATARSRFDLAQPAARFDFKTWLDREGDDALPAWLPSAEQSALCSARSEPTGRAGATRTTEAAGGEGVGRLVGVNLIGFADGVLGIGEDLRTFARVARRAAAPYGVCNVALPDEHGANQSSGLEALFLARPVFPVNLFCVPLFETERLRLNRGRDLFAGRYNIGYWAWELSTLPAYWRHAFDHVDEVWAMSPFLVDVYATLTTKPVIHMPPCVAIDQLDPVDLREFGFDDGDFVCLAMCDFNSHAARKNPVGAIRAFRAAFARRGGGERLLIKTINGHARPDQLEALLREVGEDPRIVVIDGAFSRAATHGLVAAADCLVSLHRSEGFGRVVAEAMLLRTPVVATGYSGSNSVLDETTGFPVAYRLVPVPPGDYPYAEGSEWAEPDLDDAVDRLRVAARAQAGVEARIAAAQARVSRDHGLDRVAVRFGERLAAIGAAGGDAIFRR
jgi:glycosyltransferase involved in cell wall biosynthesis